MRILLTSGVGNTDRPSRWSHITMFMGKLAKVFETLGHECCMYIHTQAQNKQYHIKNTIISTDVKPIDFKPDKVLIWNGIFDGDAKLISMFGRENCIFGELGFFDHYSTSYWDGCGTNYMSENMVQDVSDVIDDIDLFNSLISKYIKPRLYNERYVFVPLQDEKDSQIYKLSPFKTMDELLKYVVNLYNKDETIKILYKQHPHAKSKITPHPKLLEVNKDIHHYIPYAEKVIGINSNSLFETLFYHQRLLTLGLGTASRRFETDSERRKYLLNCYRKQIHQTQLSNVDVVKNSYLYSMITSSKKNSIVPVVQQTVITESKSLPKHLGGSCNVTHLDKNSILYLKPKYNIKTAYDLGCGPGGMVQYMNSIGIKCTGIDGDYTVAKDKNIIIHDFCSGPIDIENRDFCWCVEFLEQVDEKYIDNYFSVLNKCKVVCCTASQSLDGHHHVNVKPLDYWIQIFEKNGFKYNKDDTEYIRKHTSMKREFIKQTGMIFYK